MTKNNEVASESIRQRSAGGLKIVVVEDSILMRAHVVASLNEIKGVAPIRQAEDVPSGLRVLEAVWPDVLILDIGLPGKSGLDLLRIVRRCDPAVVIIMLTIHNEPKLRQSCAELGANYFFNKLQEFERVAEVCRDLAERRARQAGA
ncbi:MAG: response regulator transcription factor [Limisphaerales bacterium]